MPNKHSAFGIWITGLPASGKSTLASWVRALLERREVDVAVLESDELRKVLTPHPRYDQAERDAFYHQMTFIGNLLIRHGVPVIFDATANRREYRDASRKQITRFIEVYVDCPLEVCRARDPKGIYRAAGAGAATTVPGMQSSYEPPEHPDIVVSGQEEPERAALRVVAKLVELGYVPAYED